LSCNLLLAREYRCYWFFLNLQLAIDRALLGGQQSNASFPSGLDVKIKPFPWPSKQEDIGAASAAVLLNLLLVYAFMAPTRAVVGSIVREKELRLREGMRILGLSVSCSHKELCCAAACKQRWLFLLSDAIRAA
jgi:hypothetical protein